MDKAIFERIMVCRISLLLKLPFWGNLVTRLKLEELPEDDSCKTAATNGRRIFYNVPFMAGLTDRQIVYVLCHEVIHVALDHLGRGEGYRHKIANIAADYATNQILVDDKIGDHIGNLISKKDLIAGTEKSMGTLYDPLYKGWTFEQIYQDILKELNSSDSGGNNPSLGAGSPSFDHHLDPDDIRNIPEEDMQALRDEIREAIINAAAGAGVGNVPGAFKRMLGDLLEPKMDWKQLLHSKIESQVKSDYSYMKLGRRSFSSDIIFPSRTPETKIKATLALDMSGSIGPTEIREFFSEVVGIMEQYKSYEIGIFCFDTKGYNYKQFSEDSVDDIMSYEPMGGGGTSFSAIFEFMKEHEIVPEQLVVFTDGECFGDWGDPDYCSTLWVVKNSRNIEAPFGDVAKYE